MRVSHLVAAQLTHFHMHAPKLFFHGYLLTFLTLNPLLPLKKPPNNCTYALGDHQTITALPSPISVPSEDGTHLPSSSTREPPPSAALALISLSTHKNVTTFEMA